MNLRQQLVTLADCYLASIGRARATLSTTLLKDGKILDRLARGEADVTTVTFERAVLWFDQNWPTDLPWPAGVARPSLVAQAADTEAA